MAISVYHGSRHPIRSFSTQYMKNGEGNHSFGWGIYFSDTEKVGRYYMTAGGKPDNGVGYLYRVELMVDPSSLLDWDYAEQPPAVASALEAIKGQIPGFKYPPDSPGHTIYSYLTAYLVPEGASREKALAMCKNTWDVMVDDLSVRYGSAMKQASELLDAHGVPGIRYLDGASRDKGSGTYNYTIFNESNVVNYDPALPDEKGQGLLFASKRLVASKGKKESEPVETDYLSTKLGARREVMKTNQFHVTPFGVLVDKDVGNTAFDEDSFYRGVMAPAERDTFKKHKASFIEDPTKKSGLDLTSRYRFIPWGVSIISSPIRRRVALEHFIEQAVCPPPRKPASCKFLSSATWALDKELLPDFIRLLGELKTKFYDVLGDEELLSALEKAEHRAHELLVSEGGDSPVTSAAIAYKKALLASGVSPAIVLDLGSRFKKEGEAFVRGDFPSSLTSSLDRVFGLWDVHKSVLVASGVSLQAAHRVVSNAWLALIA